MKLELISKEKNSMELKIHDEGESLLIPLKNQLLSDEVVEYANYNVRHPKLDTPPFYFKVRSGKPQNALKKACRALSNTYKEMLVQFQKQS
ncbi:MAG TPA: DNA-directed RNA polymerase subunit L [Euryarchaeota archaeon]|nr:DNA-directed RNA polymerase subunit L [Euryarchaeota archaeon]